MLPNIDSLTVPPPHSQSCSAVPVFFYAGLYCYLKMWKAGTATFNYFFKLSFSAPSNRVSSQTPALKDLKGTLGFIVATTTIFIYLV